MKLEKVTQENFNLFDSIFTPGGSCCYCVVWRTYDQTWEKRCKDPSLPNLELAKNFVRDGVHLGYLIFEDNNFVGFTSSGPKTEFPLLQTKLGSRLSPFNSKIWSIGCISLKDNTQRDVKQKTIIKALSKEAQKNKAEFLEAYPTIPWDKARSYRGHHEIYRDLGFNETFQDLDGESKILCMRLKL